MQIITKKLQQSHVSCLMIKCDQYLSAARLHFEMKPSANPSKTPRDSAGLTLCCIGGFKKERRGKSEYKQRQKDVRDGRKVGRERIDPYLEREDTCDVDQSCKHWNAHVREERAAEHVAIRNEDSIAEDGQKSTWREMMHVRSAPKNPTAALGCACPMEQCSTKYDHK